MSIKQTEVIISKMRELILSMNTTLDEMTSGELNWMKVDTDQTWDSFFEKRGS